MQACLYRQTQKELTWKQQSTGSEQLRPLLNQQRVGKTLNEKEHSIIYLPQQTKYLLRFKAHVIRYTS